MRCGPPPIRWKPLWPTIFGRCPPIRRCSTFSDELTDDVVECGGQACAIAGLLTRGPHTRRLCPFLRERPCLYATRRFPVVVVDRIAWRSITSGRLDTGERARLYKKLRRVRCRHA